MRDRWLVLIAAAGLAFYAAWAAFVALTDRPLDYYTYLIAADVLARGENIFPLGEAEYAAVAQRLGITNYAPPYRYPLLTALVVLPLRPLPLRLGAFIWVFASGAAAVGAALLLGAHAPRMWQRRAIALAVVAFVPILTTLHAGQVNTFPLLFTSAALYAWRRQSDTWSGAWLAVGLWFKPFAVALPALAVWRARWRVLAGIAAASAGITLATVLVFGAPLNIAQLEIFTGYQGIATMPIPTNQNITGLLARWLTAHPFGASLADSPQAVLFLRLALTAAAGLILLWRLGPPGAPRQPVQIEASLFIVATHLLFTQTWYHHLAMVFIAFAVLIEQWDDWRRLTPAMVGWGVAFALIDAHGLLWHRFVGQTLLLDFATWGQVIVFGLLLSAARRNK